MRRIKLSQFQLLNLIFNLTSAQNTMKSLVESVKNCALQAQKASCSRTFLNSTVTDPVSQRIVQQMQELTPEMLGCTGDQDPFYFKGNLNRVTITGENCEDFRLVLFFIKKGTIMPLHDHPNMSVFFRLVFGELKYHGFDKVDEKFKYNDFSHDEYLELLANKTAIKAKKTKQMILKKDAVMYVRPSFNNLHTFEAQENSCFFDICLPNYTPQSHFRKITYFKESESCAFNAQTPFTDDDLKQRRATLTDIVYDTTPPILPTNFAVHDVPYRGSMLERTL